MPFVERVRKGPSGSLERKAEEMIDQKMESYLADWAKREEVAESMVPLIGKLYRECGVVTTIYGRSLVHNSTIDILKAHRFARQVIKDELCMSSSFAVLQALSRLDLAPTRIDIGKLTTRFQESKANGDVDAFVRRELAEINGAKTLLDKPQDVVLYGFGRVGRILARILIARSGGGDKWRLRAVVVRTGSEDDLVKRASLLRRDSIHGPFRGTIVMDQEENAIVANGNMIRLLYSDSPEDVDYSTYGIENAIVLDNTGVWRDREGLERHLQAPGVAKVVLTAPGKGDVPNIVYGINNECIVEEERILSAGSCTTNAIAPVLKVVHDRYGIASVHIETCHSYTNDQNLIDNYHKHERRGARSTAEHGHNRHRGGQRRGQGPAGIERQAHGQCHSRAHPQCLPRHSESELGTGSRHRGDQYVPAGYLSRCAPGRPDRLYELS